MARAASTKKSPRHARREAQARLTGAQTDRDSITAFDPDRRDRSFTFRMREILKLFSSGLALDLRQYRVTTGQWQFLRALWEADGRSQRELGEELNITSAATVFAVNILERDELATRQPDPADSRRSLIFLTPRGHRLRLQLRPFFRQMHLDALEGFSDQDAAELDQLLGRIRDNLKRSLARRRSRKGSKKKGHPAASRR